MSPTQEEEEWEALINVAPEKRLIDVNIVISISYFFNMEVAFNNCVLLISSMGGGGGGTGRSENFFPLVI